MITIIVGTNRQDSNSARIAQHYAHLLSQKNIPYQILDLRHHRLFERNEEFIKVEAQYLIPAQAFIFIIPEYNGSFPGILKLMMDHSDINNAWFYKQALLTGVADGRGGNVRGLDHFTNILNYLKINVHFHKVHISRVKSVLDHNGNLSDENTINEINTQVSDFLKVTQES